MNKSSNKKILITLIAVIIVIAGCPTVLFVRNYMNRQKEQRDEAYSRAISEIEAGNYGEARSLLRPLEGRADYPDIKMILLYARLVEYREDNRKIEDQKDTLYSYDNSYQGVFSEELAALSVTVNAEYTAYIEEQKRIREEQAAEREREYREKVAKDIPFEGMKEDYIDRTLVGRHSEMNTYDTHKGVLHQYIWRDDSGKYIVLMVNCYDGKVDSFDRKSEDYFWNKDGSPHFGSSRKAISNSNSSKSSSSGKKSHNSYDKGYNAVYEDGDYDWDRYQNDSDYAEGVDDALDDLDEYGYDW